MVWGGELETRSGFVLDGGVRVEFGAVVGGDGSGGGLFALDERDDLSVEFVGGARSQLSDDDVLGLSFDQGNDAVTVMGAHDGVRFPMAEARAVLGTRWALRDVALVGENSPRIGAPIAFSAFLGGLT